MVEVPDHLAPQDGASDYHVRLWSIEPQPDHSANFKFALVIGDDEVSEHAIHRDEIRVGVNPTKGGTVAGLYARAYGALIDALRQMLHEAEVHRKLYEAEAMRAAPPSA